MKERRHRNLAGKEIARARYSKGTHRLGRKKSNADHADAGKTFLFKKKGGKTTGH